MGARALFEALRHPFHNELSARQRNGIPRIYFEGNNLDNDAVGGLLDLLSNPDSPSNSREDRWGIVPISKSGGTLETAVAFRIFRDALERSFGSDSPALKQLVVPITGATGKLRDLATDAGYRHVFEIPDDVGGRFSVFTAVGLFPAAMMGIDVEQLLSGAADMTRRFFSAPLGENPVLDYTATCHLFEADAGMTVRLLSTWGSRLEALGFWYDQLLSESLGKQEKGATPITVVNTRDLHSRGQQHQEGRRDKLITNVIVETPSNDPLKVPKSAIDHDQLNRLHNKTLPELLAAATEGTNQAYAAVERPTADILLAELTPYAMGELLQMFMLATVLEGRLIAINPYGQPGVEAYKQNMTAIIDRG
jgi:glucose-6-phosphate isomerase